MAGLTNYRDPSLFGLHRLNRFLDEAFAAMPTAEQGSVITSAWFAPTDVSNDISTEPSDPRRAILFLATPLTEVKEPTITGSTKSSLT